MKHLYITAAVDNIESKLEDMDISGRGSISQPSYPGMYQGFSPINVRTTYFFLFFFFQEYLRLLQGIRPQEGISLMDIYIIWQNIKKGKKQNTKISTSFQSGKQKFPTELPRMCHLGHSAYFKGVMSSPTCGKWLLHGMVFEGNQIFMYQKFLTETHMIRKNIILSTQYCQ